MPSDTLQPTRAVESFDTEPSKPERYRLLLGDEFLPSGFELAGTQITGHLVLVQDMGLNVGLPEPSVLHAGKIVQEVANRICGIGVRLIDLVKLTIQRQPPVLGRAKLAIGQRITAIGAQTGLVLNRHVGTVLENDMVLPIRAFQGLTVGNLKSLGHLLLVREVLHVQRRVHMVEVDAGHDA